MSEHIIETQQRAMNVKYAPVLGMRTPRRGPYVQLEYVGCNDLGFPYFAKVLKNGRAGKKHYYTSYSKPWLDAQLAEISEILRYMNA